ncbi:MAG: hypothetical protein NZ552_08255 [Planctomycetes bacterium]|nr:hypothetical protein [Planctomycetota bacterium]
MAEVRELCDDAELLLAAGYPEEASARLDALAAQVASLPHEQQEQVQRLRKLIEDACAQAALRRGAGLRRQAQWQALGERFEQAQQPQAWRAEQLRRIADLEQRGHLELALAQARALSVALPDDAEVEGAFRRLLSATHQRRLREIAAREQELRREVALRVERALLPTGFAGQPIYPEDWASRRVGRRVALEVAETEPEWRAALRDRLTARVSFHLEGATLATAIETLSRLGGINIIAASELLAGEHLVSLRAVGMSLADALTWVAEQAGTRWDLADGAVYLGPLRVAAPVVVLHDIADLLLGTRDFPGPRLNLENAGSTGATFAAAQEPSPAPTADDIVELIRRVVTPRVWQEPGMGIVVRGMTLLVTAPPDTQRLIREFLRAQSAQRGLAARLQVRWLELSDRVVEEIGVQWSQGPMIAGHASSTAGVVRRLEGWSFEGTTVHPLPGSALSVQPPLAGSGLTLQAALINSTRFDVLLSAVERTAAGRVLLAPDLVCQNNQRAHCFLGDQAAIISDYEIQGRNYDPVIQVLQVGTALDVRPTISADRKYVTLELQAATTDATWFTEYLSVIRVLDSEGATYFAGAQYPIELPNVALRSAATTVMLPDGGSLLIGGFARALDQFAASRVPVLGSIPFLGRLFGMRGRYYEQRKLYLATTVSIIDYADLEDRL